LRGENEVSFTKEAIEAGISRPAIDEGDEKPPFFMSH
jgi:hypothetical protein